MDTRLICLETFDPHLPFPFVGAEFFPSPLVLSCLFQLLSEFCVSSHCILVISKSQHEPVYINGEFKPRLMMPLSLSYDHRVIDGADAARFVDFIVKMLEDTFVISLEG